MPDAPERIAELEAENERLKSWITAANQFMWAHEKDCPRRETGGECTCGLDQFLSRPRPFIESYKQRIAELEMSNRMLQKTIDSMDAEIKGMDKVRDIVERDYQRQLQTANKRVETAVAKLATRLTANNDW